MMSIRVKILVLLVILLVGLYNIQEVFAIFTLNATPYEGGYDLRYGKIASDDNWVNKEMSISIQSDINKQYRLIQMMVQPLTNAQGDTIPLDNFRVYSLRGTNKYGTMSVENEAPVAFGRMVIYTSNQTGSSDSFVLAYRLMVPPGQAQGAYRGRINYTLEPIGSLQGAVNVDISVYAEIDTETKIEITTPFSAKRISLKQSDIEEDGYSDVVVNIVGSLGSQYRILQILEPLRNQDGKELSSEAIKFTVEEAKKGIPGAIEFTDLFSSKQQTVYTSEQRGDGDNFIITYALVDTGKDLAGRYTGTVKYVLDGGMLLKQGLIDTVALEIDIPRVFDAVVTPETFGKIEFLDIRKDREPKLNEVLVDIKTNIGKKYQVSQNILSDLTNSEGKTIPSKYFTFKAEPLDSKGVVKFTEETEVKKGETVLFISDVKGESDSFKVTYELNIPLDIPAGDYSTRITYSLTEI
ncbi:MAG: hypothetical protein ABH848_02475 [Candidatus Omnitrophota bacterium]